MGEHADKQTGSALVVATFSRAMKLRVESGDVIRARIKGKKIKPVCGDYVSAQPIVNEPEWLITGIDKRRNELTRPDSRGRVEILAANIDRLCVMVATTPSPDWYIVDRYLCAAEIMRVDAAVIFNKTDLDGASESTDSELSVYSALGYPTVRCSAKSGENLDRLMQILAQNTSIIVGQSGVGKSSIINCLVDNADLKTRAVSAATGEGRHTTVNSQLLTLSNGAQVIDSPGVREYAPAIQETSDVVVGFREILAAGHRCKFANCRHSHEPGCAVKAQVASGEISSRRYDSFRRLIVLTEQLASKRRY